jgi:hypothetical protein
VQQIVAGPPTHLAETTLAKNIQRMFAADVTDAGTGDCVVLRWFCDGIVQRGREARDTQRSYLLPAELRAAGLMVPVGSMMPFPMPAFDKVWTGCIEYIPDVARSSRARAQLSVGQRAQGRTNWQSLVERGRGARGKRRDG